MHPIEGEYILYVVTSVNLFGPAVCGGSLEESAFFAGSKVLCATW